MELARHFLTTTLFVENRRLVWEGCPKGWRVKLRLGSEGTTFVPHQGQRLLRLEWLQRWQKTQAQTLLQHLWMETRYVGSSRRSDQVDLCLIGFMAYLELFIQREVWDFGAV